MDNTPPQGTKENNTMTYSPLDNARFVILPDGKAIDKIFGIDMQAKMPIIYRNGEYMVFKRNGFTGWYCVGQTTYYPPEYFLVRVSHDINEKYPRMKFLVEREASRSTWRQIVSELIALADEKKEQRC